jgi:class 3 adenylate cyclase
MSRGTELSSRERHLVVVFDICSSTTILEDLKRTDNLSAWRNVLIHLKDYLLKHGAELDMNLYKFIGDGWVLLFPDDVSKTALCDMLRELSQSYELQFEASIRPLLSQEPNPIGLMFGIDAGELIRLELNGQVEYLGRAINVASRLQSYTKELPGGPSYKVIFSKNSYNSPAPPPPELAAEAIKVSLRNISPATMQCFTLQPYQGKLSKAISGATIAAPVKPPVAASPVAVSPIAASPIVTSPVYAIPATGSATAIKSGPNIRVTDLRTMQISALGAGGKWTAHSPGQLGVVVQLTNEVRRGGAANASTTAKATLIYRIGEKETLRVRGSWLDGFDLARFNVGDTHNLIVGVNANNEFNALETVRTSVTGSDRMETRLVRFDPIPPKATVLVQLMDADGKSLLYEGEFAIGTDPLTIVSLP